MATEAQKRAKEKYKASIKRFTIDFTPAEAELYNYLSEKPNKQRYIKDLIAKDYKSSATHKVCIFCCENNTETALFKGSEEACETYINNLIAEGKNVRPIEEYEIIKM